MGLSSQAQKEVDVKLKELYEAFRAGFVSTGEDVMFIENKHFKFFLETFHPELADYFTDSLVEGPSK